MTASQDELAAWRWWATLSAVERSYWGAMGALGGPAPEVVPVRVKYTRDTVAPDPTSVDAPVLTVVVASFQAMMRVTQRARLRLRSG